MMGEEYSVREAAILSFNKQEKLKTLALENAVKDILNIEVVAEDGHCVIDEMMVTLRTLGNGETVLQSVPVILYDKMSISFPLDWEIIRSLADFGRLLTKHGIGE